MLDLTVNEGQDMLRAGVRWAFNTHSWTPTSAQLMPATSAIQPEEKERIGKFVFARDAQASLVGRLMMRKYLAQHTGSWTSAFLARDENGKPWAPRSPNVLFNVSHHGRWIVMAGNSDNVASLGVDIMGRKLGGNQTRQRFFRIMERHFAQSEWHHILSKPEDEQEAEFFRFWSLKEAYVKATGTGITVDLRQIAFNPASLLNTSEFVCDTTVAVNGNVLEDWTFQEMLLDIDHVVCVAVKSADGHIASPCNFSVLSFDNLIQEAASLTSPDQQFCENFLAKPYAPDNNS